MKLNYILIPTLLVIISIAAMADETLNIKPPIVNSKAVGLENEQTKLFFRNEAKYIRESAPIEYK